MAPDELLPHVRVRLEAGAPAGYRLHSHSPQTGVTKYRRFNYNASRPSASTVDYVTVQDVESVLDDISRVANDAKGTFTRKGCWGAHVATIPHIIWLKWKTEHNVDVYNPRDESERKKALRLLNCSDWAKLRVQRFAA